MKANPKALVSLILVQLLLWGMVLLPSGEAGTLVRVAAQFRQFDGTLTQTSTTPSAGGVVVWTKSFKIPAPPSGQQPVVFITVSATRSADDLAAVALNCTINGTNCNGGNALASEPGWILATVYDPDFHGGAFTYIWCTKVNPGTHTAVIRVASDDGSESANFWGAHFYIDRATFPEGSADACTQGAP